MPTETVRVDWIEGQVYLLRDHKGFPVVMTQPQGVLGADLLPLSVIGCAAWDVAAILRKARQQVTAFEVLAHSEREEEAPWRFTNIRIVYKISGEDIDPAHVQRAIDLTEQKYCSTYATLRRAVDITSSFEIVDGRHGNSG